MRWPIRLVNYHYCGAAYNHIKGGSRHVNKLILLRKAVKRFIAILHVFNNAA
jgi:hypothetical protein